MNCLLITGMLWTGRDAMTGEGLVSPVYED